jgi:hypothetical protein
MNAFVIFLINSLIIMKKNWILVLSFVGCLAFLIIILILITKLVKLQNEVNKNEKQSIKIAIIQTNKLSTKYLPQKSTPEHMSSLNSFTKYDISKIV